MAGKLEPVKQGFQALMGFFRGGRGAPTARSISKFNVLDLPSMRSPAGPSSPWPRQTTSLVPFQNAGARATQFFGKERGPGALFLGALGLGGIGYLGTSLLDYLARKQAPIAQGQYSTAGPTFAERALSQPKEAELLKELYASPAFTQQLSAPNYAAAVAASNATTLKSLEDYLTGVEGMGKQSAKAIADAYSELGKSTAALGETQQVRGQDIAAEIDRLYQQLGLAEAELAAGGGVSAAPTDISGLVPMGGEIATAQQTTPTYGASLADYLGREATIGGQALAQQALSQAEQGAGTATGLQNMIALASLQQRSAAGQAAADRLAQAQLADMQAQRDLDMMKLQMDQQRASDLFQATQRDLQRERDVQDIAMQARESAKFVWDTASPTFRATLQALFNDGSGDGGRLNFITAVTNNPQLLDRVTGLQG